jgi:hypothetical protein
VMGREFWVFELDASAAGGVRAASNT